MIHRKFRLEVINILNITRYATKNECLIPWVKFFWHIEAANADIHYKLLPTDCIDVILNLADDVVYETECNKIIAPPFHINGLRSKYSFIHQEKTIRIFGISFYPHGLYPFVHKSLKEVQNKVVDLNGLSYSLGDFITISDDISIKSFCDKRSINIKTFERMVLYHTGYTPKILRRIKRFQNTCNQLVHQHISLTDITYDNNFTDQSYFIKEFTRFSGTAPRTFQTEKATVKENVKYKYL